MKRRITFSLALVALVAAGCGTPDDDGAADASQQQQADAGDTTPDAGDTTPDAGDTTPDAGTEGAPNDQAAGTWTLSGSPACNLSFSGTWQGVRTAASGYRFTISKSQQETLDCTIRATDTTKFTCADVTAGGQIGANCTAAYSFSEITGTFAGNAVDLTAKIRVSSPNCGQALNCGPSTHNASGTIAH